MARGYSLRSHNFKIRRLRDILLAKHDYDEIILNMEYGPRSRPIGEVDLLGVQDHLWDFYEVKCTDDQRHYRKARSQYQRFKEHFGEIVRSGFFYAGKDITEILI
jgi:hypothetical protein